MAQQALGFAGLGLLALSWQFRAQHSILAVNAVAFLFFAAGLHVLGAAVGTVMILFAALMAVTAIFTRATWVMLMLLLAPAALGLSIAERAVDLLPIAAHVTGGIAFFRKTTVAMRRWAPVGTVLWAIYNVIVGAWGQFMADLLILGSMALGAWRNR
jgi:hypothetical protein